MKKLIALLALVSIANARAAVPLLHDAEDHAKLAALIGGEPEHLALVRRIIMGGLFGQYDLLAYRAGEFYIVTPHALDRIRVQTSCAAIVDVEVHLGRMWNTVKIATTDGYQPLQIFNNNNGGDPHAMISTLKACAAKHR